MTRIKTQKVLYNFGNGFKMNTFLTVLPRAVFRIQSKVYGGAFFAKTAATYFYMILYDFLNCLAFVDIKQIRLKINNRVNII